MTEDVCGSTNTTSNNPCQWNTAERGPCPFHDDDTPTPDNGRDSKLTKERQSGIANKLANGKSIESAARMHGITPQTVYNWLDRGMDEENTIYADFFEEITRARGQGEEKYFNTIWELAREQGDHRFLASLMKQRYPDSWGDTETGVEADTVQLEVSERVTSSWPDASQ